MSRQLGLILRNTFPAQTIITAAKEAERLGYQTIWVTEGSGGKDAFTQLAAVAMNTRSIAIGSAIVPIYLRTAALAAMSIMAVDELSKGRAILGVGVSHTYIVEQIHQAKLERPLGATRQYVQTARQAIGDPAFNFRGQEWGAGIRFQPVRRNIPIYIAALRPKMVQLGGAIADGVLTNLVPQPYLKQAVDLVKEAAVKAGRKPGDVPVVALVMVAISQDRQQALETLSPHIARYTWMPFYNQMLREAGFAKEMDAVAGEVARGDVLGAATKLSPELLLSIGIAGTAREARRALDAFFATGIDQVAVFPVMPRGSDPTKGIMEIVKAMAS